jgi:hypothetical protein
MNEGEVQHCPMSKIFETVFGDVAKPNTTFLFEWQNAAQWER